MTELTELTAIEIEQDLQRRLLHLLNTIHSAAWRAMSRAWSGRDNIPDNHVEIACEEFDAAGISMCVTAYYKGAGDLGSTELILNEMELVDPLLTERLHDLDYMKKHGWEILQWIASFLADIAEPSHQHETHDWEIEGF